MSSVQPCFTTTLTTKRHKFASGAEFWDYKAYLTLVWGLSSAKAQISSLPVQLLYEAFSNNGYIL